MRSNGVEGAEEPVRFVLDAHLGGLAAYLRMLGFDVLWRNDSGDDELARLSRDEGRLLLSRDRPLLSRPDVGRASFVRASRSREQLREVVERFDLLPRAEPFSRCMECNALLVPATKERLRDRLLPATFESFEEFLECPGCERVYWKGSHYDRMRALIEGLRSELKRPA